MATGWDGVQEVLRILSNLGKDALEEGGRALYQEALIEMKESMARTPVATGALRASHVTDPPAVTNGEVSVAIRVGGPSVPYAMIVHENLDAYHPVGQAKFLESTLYESAPHMAERVADRLRARYGT